jgi:mevalonate kinase
MKRTVFVFLLGLAGGLLAHNARFVNHRPGNPSGLDAQLAWMKSSLHLSDAQFEHIKVLHAQSSPQLQALATQVARMRAEFAAFENTRRTTGEVDFLEFARFVEQRRAVDRECAESTRRLIVAAVSVMTQQQRDQYCRTLLNSGVKPIAADSLN